MRTHVLVVASLALVGCSTGSSPSPASPSSPLAAAPAPADPSDDGLERALAHAPAGTLAMIGVDVAALASGPYADGVRGLVTGLDLPPTCGEVSMFDLGRVTISMRGETDAVLTSSGRLPEAAAVSCLTDIMAGKGGRLVPSMMAGRRVYSAEGSPEDNGWITWPAPDRPLMATSEAGLRDALDARAPRIDRALADVARATDRSRTVWLAARVLPEQVAAMELPLPPLAAPMSVRIGVALGDEIDADIVLGAGDASDPARVADAEALADRLRQLATAVPAGWAAQLAATARIQVDGADVRIQLHADRDTVAEIRRHVRVK